MITQETSSLAIALILGIAFGIIGINTVAFRKKERFILLEKYAVKKSLIIFDYTIERINYD